MEILQNFVAFSEYMNFTSFDFFERSIKITKSVNSEIIQTQYLKVEYGYRLSSTTALLPGFLL